MTVTYEEALAAVTSRLGEKAATHSQRVADVAATLAILYGVNPAQARIAGVLHDWDRELSAQELLEAADAVGMRLTDAEMAHPHLLHARTGGAALRDALPGLDDDVADAVSRHTVGSAEMTPLDMVVYLADMIEPQRHYPGVTELRDAVGVVSLGELFALGYQQSVLHLVRARRPIHPDTVVVWNTFVAGGPR
jgi:predicted HD superfamily hydrolase involved in NAD metabolism